MRTAAAALLAAALASPASAIGENEDAAAVPSLQLPGGLLLFYKATGPMSFVAMTPKDLPQDARQLGEVRSVSCQRGVSVPISPSWNATSVSSGYGDGGYRKALELMKQQNPELAGIYDVRVDLGIFSLLNGLYRSLCTYVTARGFALPSS